MSAWTRWRDATPHNNTIHPHVAAILSCVLERRNDYVIEERETEAETRNDKETMKSRNIIWHRTGNVNSERESTKECARYYGAGETKGTPSHLLYYWAVLLLRDAQIPLRPVFSLPALRVASVVKKENKNLVVVKCASARLLPLLVVGSADGAIVIDCTTAAVDGPFSDATRYNIWDAHNAAVIRRQLGRNDESK